MKAHVIAQQDERLAFVDRPEPEPGPHDVVVDLRATSLNHRDHLRVQGLYPGAQDRLIPLSDGSGETIAIGSEVTR